MMEQQRYRYGGIFELASMCIYMNIFFFISFRQVKGIALRCVELFFIFEFRTANSQAQRSAYQFFF
jgi:hypothetical protein